MDDGVRARRKTGRWQRVGPGLDMRALVEGEGTALVLYRIAPGFKFKLHSHRFPEYGTVVSGRGTCRLQQTVQTVSEGDSYYVPTGVPHGFEVAKEGKPVVILHVAVGLAAPVRAPMFRHLLRHAREVVTDGAEERTATPHAVISTGGAARG